MLSRSTCTDSHFFQSEYWVPGGTREWSTPLVHRWFEQFISNLEENDLLPFDHLLHVLTVDFWKILNTKCSSLKKTLNQWNVKVETSCQTILWLDLIEGELQNNKLFWFRFLPFFSRLISILEIYRLKHGPVTLHGHSAGCRRVWSLLVNPDRKRQTNQTKQKKPNHQNFNHKFIFICIKI